MISKGVQNVNKQLSSGPIPRRVGFFFLSGTRRLFIQHFDYVFFSFILSEDAFVGDMHKSPFAYNHFKLKNFQLMIGEWIELKNVRPRTDSYRLGEKRYPMDPLTADFEENMCGEMYSYFLDQIRSYGVIGTARMNMEKYKNNRVFIFFDLTEDMSAGSSYHVEQGDGITAVFIHFTEPLKENIIMIQISEYDRSLEISTNSQISVGEAGGLTT